MSIENRVTKTESRIKTLEDALVFLTALGDSHNDQLEAFLFSLEELKANQQNTDEKLCIFEITEFSYVLSLNGLNFHLSFRN